MKPKTPLEAAYDTNATLVNQNIDLKRQIKLMADEVAKWKKEVTRIEKELLQFNEYRHLKGI